MSVLDSVSQNRAERRKQQTHEAILDATRVLLWEVGYPHMSIRMIAEHADVGYGTFYLHFADKDDAVWEVLEVWMRVLMTDVETHVLSLPFMQREYVSWVRTFEQLDTTRESFLAIFGKQGSRKLLEKYQDFMVQTHLMYMRKGVYQSGLDLPTEFLAQFITGAMIRLMTWWAEGNTGYTAHDMARLLFEAVYRRPVP